MKINFIQNMNFGATFLSFLCGTSAFPGNWYSNLEAFTVGKVTLWHGRSPDKFEDRQNENYSLALKFL